MSHLLDAVNVVHHQTVRENVLSLFPTGRIQRVLLVTPPDADAEVFRLDTARRGRYTNYPPYGLGILAQKLRAQGIDVQMCNLNHTLLKAARQLDQDAFCHETVWRESLTAAVAEFKPDLVGVTCMFTMTHLPFKKVCRCLNELGQVVAAGGVHVTNDVDHILDDIPEISFAFLREGELAFTRFLQFVNVDAPTANLGQMIFNLGPADEKQRIRFLNDCRPDGNDINWTPAYDLMDVRGYSTVGTIGAFYYFRPKETVFATVLSNRGCRAQCTFCSVRNFNGKGVRSRDHVLVVDEIQELVERYGVGHIMWLDDDLLKDSGRAIAMFNELARRQLPVTWDATNGLIASSCTDEVIDAMAASGCIAVNIGMESGNSDILRQVRKPGTVENFIEAAAIFRKYPKIHTSVLLMLGFPGETFGMIQDTIDVAKAMDCDWYRITPLQPLPNTPIYDAMVAQGLLKEDNRNEVRFMGGSYGKQAEIEQGLRLAELDLFASFRDSRPGDIPPPDQITDIWFYMNYHLNFHRVFFERRPEKIAQLRHHLTALSDVIAPENGFALYFMGFLDCRANGMVDRALIARLRRRLDTSPYWRTRLAGFGLCVEDLETGRFPTDTITPLFRAN